MSKLKSVNSILLRAPNWLGDCVMALPSIAVLRRAYPQALLTVEARPGVSPLFNWVPEVDKVIPCPSGGGMQNFSAKWSHAVNLQKEGFDAGILYPNSLSTAFWLWRSRVRQRIGTGVNGRGVLLTDRIPLTKEMKTSHQAWWYLQLLAPLGIEFKSKDEEFLGYHNLQKPADKATKTSETPSDKAPYAVLAPGSAYGPAKNWLPEGFAQISKRLVNDAGMKVIITGTSADAPLAEKIVSLAACVGVESIAGKTNLDGFLALLSKASAFIGNDSGAAHCAAAFSIPTVVIFGSTRPGCTRPLGKKVACLVGEAPCAPCMRRTCNNPTTPMECMENITESMVWHAFQDIYQL